MRTRTPCGRPLRPDRDGGVHGRNHVLEFDMLQAEHSHETRNHGHMGKTSRRTGNTERVPCQTVTWQREQPV